jgi:N-acetylmuramoyl-L-alanine amidase
MKSIKVLKIYAIIASALLVIDIGSAFLINNMLKPAVVQNLSADAASIYAVNAVETATAEASPSPSPSPSEPKERFYSNKDKILIAKVVYAESRGEPFEGQAAVAAVVINRYESGRFGKTIKRVVYAKNQFSVGKRYNKQNMAAVEKAIAEDKYPNNMFYFKRSKSHHWRNFKFYCRIGHHNFFLGG